MLQRRELIFELFTPDTFTTRTIAHGITSLYHKLTNHTVEDNVVVVAVFSMCNKILHGLRRSFRIQPDCDVAVGGVDGGGGAGGGLFCFLLLLGVELAGLFVVDVAFGFGDTMVVSYPLYKSGLGRVLDLLIFVREHVEPDFA